MARPRQFDEEGAVEAAMRAFWIAGYDGVSTQELCAATGLGRSSIYNTFRSKRDLFERALRRYMADKNSGTFALLEGPGSTREKIRTLLYLVVDASDSDPLGCLVVNATVELGQRDPEMARLLHTDLQRRLTAVTAAVAAGQRAGEIATGRDPADIAQFVVATISGMRVASRGGAERATLAAIADVALAAL
ncbi:TetR/AcrR family transcriptional regulator [Nocardia aurantia]|uniref:HTH-type transcriptional repressor ComR n=1 Tax=Nocardia aurantia TaxID=2585199 RepID=A0A7K0DN38_9NOCA|nr:TetR/AcrR family transcriptional regulator [Nocardia aurantia]MQY27097.1 HTH-type transcriptional repressor ComR [Nocardia aurantia]